MRIAAAPGAPTPLPCPHPATGDATRAQLTSHFIDTQTGWVVQDGGRVLHTRDGGQTWALQPTGWPRRLTSVYASSASSVWLGGAHNAMLVSRSGGQ